MNVSAKRPSAGSVSFGGVAPAASARCGRLLDVVDRHAESGRCPCGVRQRQNCEIEVAVGEIDRGPPVRRGNDGALRAFRRRSCRTLRALPDRRLTARGDVSAASGGPFRLRETGEHELRRGDRIFENAVLEAGVEYGLEIRRRVRRRKTDARHLRDGFVG